MAHLVPSRGRANETLAFGLPRSGRPDVGMGSIARPGQMSNPKSPLSPAVASLDTTADIETPEHVRFRHRLAGPSRRAIAYLVDLVIRGIVLVLFLLLGLLGGLAHEASDGHLSRGVLFLLLFAMDWGYFVFWELVWSGQSPGKRLLGLRVVTGEGHPLTFVQSVLRNLVRGADALPVGYAIGAVVMARDARFRRLGDLVAGTMVVAEDSAAIVEPLALHPPPSAEDLRGLPARLPLSGEELDAIEAFLRRAARLHPARQAELASYVSPIFAKRLGVRVLDPARFLGILYYRANAIASPSEPSLPRKRKHPRRARRDDAFSPGVDA